MQSVTPTRPALGLHAAAQTDDSRRWFDRARAVLAGGVSSSARATTTGPLDHPLYVARGRGSRVWDVDGNQFVDYLLGYGSSILGHADPDLTAAVAAQLDLGTMFGTCNTVEVELAEQICRMVPCAGSVRFANSGSEAIQGAVRAARGFTGRTKVLKFEGHYHGWVDTLAVSNRPPPDQAGPADAPHSHPHSLGMSPAAVADVVVCPWNNPAALDAILAAHDFAAVIAEPIVANNACVGPADHFLERLRDRTAAAGALLIFDEIVTGFRVAPGGAQELFGVVPDLAVYSKAIGGGLPIGAFAGRRDVMALVAANAVKHGGTYNANPLCSTAALHTLRTLARPAVQARIRSHGEAVMDAVRRSAHDGGVDVVVQGVGSMFQVLFTDRPPRNYREVSLADAARYAAFRHALLVRGVHANSSGLACWFVSAAHTADDAAVTASAVERAMAAVG